MQLPMYIEDGTAKGEKIFSSSYNVIQSIVKNITYLQRISYNPIKIKIFVDNKEYNFILKPTKKIKVSKNLIRQYNCLDYKCSRCCRKVRYWNIFTQKQYNDIVNKYVNEIFEIKKINVKINGKDFTFFCENHTEKICGHLDRKNEKCKVHDLNPIHCALPLIKFKQVKDITYVTREIFGRNWCMQCPVKFKPMDKNSFNMTLYMFDRIKKMANELFIKTEIDFIINETKKIYHKTTAQKQLWGIENG